MGHHQLRWTEIAAAAEGLPGRDYECGVQADLFLCAEHTHLHVPKWQGYVSSRYSMISIIIIITTLAHCRYALASVCVGARAATGSDYRNFNRHLINSLHPQHDSGGPLLWTNARTGLLYLVGMSSYGLYCAGSEPGVNTRVASYLSWIQQNTAGTQFCRPVV